MTHSLRLSDRLEHYWQHIRGDAPMPSLAQVQHRAISDLWDSCFTIIIEDDAKYRFEHFGMSFLESYGLSFSPSGQRVYDELIRTYAQRITTHIPDVIASKTPLNYEDALTQDGDITVKYRLSLLPLSSNGRDVNALLGGMRWRGDKLALRF